MKVSVFQMNKCIGLFGTCDNIKWRDQFMEAYNKLGISYFNPMVENWDPSLAEIEAKHLAEDEIILFPILKESYGLGSLAEVAFGPLKALHNKQNRQFIILVDNDLVDSLKEDKLLAKNSIRARNLVKAHLKDLNMDNVHVVETLDEMLKLSLELHNV